MICENGWNESASGEKLSLSRTHIHHVSDLRRLESGMVDLVFHVPDLITNRELSHFEHEQPCNIARNLDFRIFMCIIP